MELQTDAFLCNRGLGAELRSHRRIGSREKVRADYGSVIRLLGHRPLYTSNVCTILYDVGSNLLSPNPNTSLLASCYSVYPVLITSLMDVLNKLGI